MSIPSSYQLVYHAVCMASKLHQHQMRKDGVTPYISHLTRVSHVLSNVFGCKDPVVIAAGILHDAIEDTTADFDEIAEGTSPEVAHLVAALTKDMRVPEHRREEEYDIQLKNAPWQARLVKLADVYDNLCDSILSGAKVEVRDKVRRAILMAEGQPELDSALEALRELESSV